MFQSTRRPGRHKPGSDPDHLVALLGVPPIAGGSGEGEGDGQQQPPEGGQQNEGAGNGTPKPPEGGKPDETPRFTQADLDRIIDERLKRQRDQAQRDADKARREAEEQAAAEKGEYQKLAEQRAQRIADLEGQLAQGKAVAEERDRYAAALEQHLAAQRKDLPKHVLELLDEMPVDKQLAWLAKNREQVAGGAGGPNRVPGTPRPNGADRPGDAVKTNYEALAVSGKYPRF